MASRENRRAAKIDALIAGPDFWKEPAYTPPCPDFGSDLLLLKEPARREALRDSLCTSISDRIVQAALRA